MWVFFEKLRFVFVIKSDRAPHSANVEPSPSPSRTCVTLFGVSRFVPQGIRSPIYKMEIISKCQYSKKNGATNDHVFLGGPLPKIKKKIKKLKNLRFV